MDDANDGGWIKLHRRIRKSAVWQNPNVRTLWVWALLKAAHTEHVVTVEFKRITLQPGQFLYNHPMASMETGLSQKTVRNCLEFLKSGDTPEIGQAQGSLPGNRYSIITINNWARYQGDDSGEGRQKAGAGVGKGQAEGSLINIRKKNVKKGKGADGTAPPTESLTWMQWVDACRAVGRKDPAPSDGALKAAETLAEWVPDLDEQRRIMDAFLTIDNDYLKRQGYQLANLTKYKFEEARAVADGAVKTGVASAGDDYELTGDSLAAAIECANLFGRAANE